VNRTVVDYSLLPRLTRHWLESQKVRQSKRWIRCLPYTLNLIAQAFLLGENPKVFEATVLGAELKNDMEELQEIWRESGFIGKLNIVNSIRRSPLPKATGQVYMCANFSSLLIINPGGTRRYWCHNEPSNAGSIAVIGALRRGHDGEEDDYDLREDILSQKEWDGVSRGYQSSKASFTLNQASWAAGYWSPRLGVRCWQADLALLWG
jgi:hypothetical protein